MATAKAVLWGIGWFLHMTTGWNYSISMDGELREHWPHADVGALEEAAMDLWRDGEFRSLAPVEAAARWLSPLEVKQ